MKKIYYILGLLLLAGCNKEEQSGDRAVADQLQIGKALLADEGTVSEWTGGALGVSIVPVGEDLKAWETGFNVKVEYTQGAWSPQSALRWTDGTEGSVCDLITYAPYTEVVNDPETLPLAVQADQRAPGAPQQNDLLYGRNRVTKSSTAEPVRLALDHVLSRLVFQVIFDGTYAGETGIEGLTLSLKNEGTVDLNDGSVTVTGTAHAMQPSLLSVAQPGVSQLYELTVPPQEITADAPFLTFSANGKGFVKSVAAAFRPGLCYTYRLYIGRDTDPVLVALAPVTIGQWEKETVNLPDAGVSYGAYRVGDLWPNAENPLAYVVRAKEKHRPGLMVTITPMLGTPFKSGGSLFNVLHYTDALGATRMAAFSRTDGRANLQTLELCLNQQNGNTAVWKDLSVLNYSRSLGPDWFIPAVDEWQIILDQIEQEVWDDLRQRYWVEGVVSWMQPLPDFMLTAYVYASTMGKNDEGDLTYTGAALKAETKTAEAVEKIRLQQTLDYYAAIAVRYF